MVNILTAIAVAVVIVLLFNICGLCLFMGAGYLMGWDKHV